MISQSNNVIGKKKFRFDAFIKCTTNECSDWMHKMENPDQILVKFDSIEFPITNHFDKCICKMKKKRNKWKEEKIETRTII